MHSLAKLHTDVLMYHHRPDIFSFVAIHLYNPVSNEGLPLFEDVVQKLATDVISGVKHTFLKVIRV